MALVDSRVNRSSKRRETDETHFISFPGEQTSDMRLPLWLRPRTHPPHGTQVGRRFREGR